MEVCDPVFVPNRAKPDLLPPIESGSLPDHILNFVDARRHWMFAAVVALYLLGFNGQWRIERDSALYLTIGRNLAEGQGYTYQGHRQQLAFPGLPLVFAATTRLFSGNSTTANLVLMWLAGFAVLGLTYRLFLLHAGRPTAVLMVVGLAATRLFYRYCFELLSDLPFLLGVIAFLAGYEGIFFRRCSRPDSSRRTGALDWVLLLVGLTVAIVMRPAMWILLLTIALATIWSVVRLSRGGKSRRLHIAIGLVVLAAGAAFFLIDPRHHEGTSSLGQYEEFLFDVKFKHLGQTFSEMFRSNIPDLCEATFSKALFGCPIGTGINTIVAVLVMALSCWLLWYRTLWGLWTLLTIGTLLIFKPLDRYLLPVIPLLVFAWWNFLIWLHHRLPAKWADLAFLALLIAGASTNLARLGQIVVEQRRVPFLVHYHDGRYVSLPKVAELVRQNTGQADWVLVGPKVARILTYSSHRNAIKASEQAALDPGTSQVYGLLGPSWDEDVRGKAIGHLDESVSLWASENGARLGPQIGPAIQDRIEKHAWTLHRIQPDPTIKRNRFHQSPSGHPNSGAGDD